MPNITFYPVGNGDTSLITLGHKRILMDFHHISAAETDDHDACDLFQELRNALGGDNYFDVVAFTHADKDHIKGCTEFFELPYAGSNYTGGDRVIIKELWVPAAMVVETIPHGSWGGEYEILRREIRGRLRTGKGIRIFSCPKPLLDWMKKDGLSYTGKEAFFSYAGRTVPTLTLADDGVEFFCHYPIGVGIETEEELCRNEDSLIFQVRFQEGGTITNLFAIGDSTWEILEKITEISEAAGNHDRLYWDILNIPHHCSYLALSPEKDDQSEKNLITTPTPTVAHFLKSYAANQAYVISSSNEILDTEEAYVQALPPHIQAWKGYKATIGTGYQKIYLVTMENKGSGQTKANPIRLDIDRLGVKHNNMRTGYLGAGISSVASSTARAGK